MRVTLNRESPDAVGLAAAWNFPNLRDYVGGLRFTNPGGTAREDSAFLGRTLFHDENGYMLASAAPPDITTKVTLCAWMRVATATYTGAALTLSDNTVSGYQLGTNNSSGGSIVAASEYFQAEVPHPAVLALEWFHIVGVFNTAIPSRTLYINGVLAGTNTQTYITAPPAAPTRVTLNGRYDGGYGGRTELAEARIYRRLLSAVEVARQFAPETRHDLWSPL